MTVEILLGPDTIKGPGPLAPAQVSPTERSLRRENDALCSDIERMKARLSRAWRRRDAAEAQSRASLLAEIVCEFLPTLDNLGLALESAHEARMREGLEITYRELARTLARFGLAVRCHDHTPLKESTGRSRRTMRTRSAWARITPSMSL
jgi:hypothetical protein